MRCSCTLCSRPLPAPMFVSPDVEAAKRLAYETQRRAYRDAHPHSTKLDER